MKRARMVIVTTVPETLATILRDQPRFLGRFLDVELATSPGTELKEIESKERARVHSVNMVRGIDPWQDFFSVIKMIGLLLKIRPDIVHSYTPKAGLVTMLSSFICRVPIRVHTFTGLIFPTQAGLRRKLLMWIDRLICACSTHIVPEGDGVKKDLSRFFITRKCLEKIGYGNIAGVDTKHFSISNNHITDDAQKLQVQAGLNDQNFVFVFVGRLNRDKGVRELISAFDKLSNKPHLLLVGAMDNTAPVDDATLQAIERNPRIHKLGFQADIRPALVASDVLVLPSYREGFPNVILQAGAMELPVIATDISGSNEIVDPKFNGWLVPPKQVAPLEEAMNEAMNKPKVELEAMGKRARARIKERFEREDHWNRMLEFYSACLASKRLPQPAHDRERS